jgi:hypothetical protein
MYIHVFLLWFQVQGELHICRKDICYFVVWSPKEFHYQVNTRQISSSHLKDGELAGQAGGFITVGRPSLKCCSRAALAVHNSDSIQMLFLPV